MTYSLTIQDANGVRRTITREAETSTEAVAAARTEGLLVLSAAEAKGVGTLPGALHPAWLLPMTGFDVEMGLRQLASMLKSGVTLAQALETVADQARNPRSTRTWRRIRDAILSGSTFADALMAQGRRFGELVVRLARVGEHSGELGLALTRSAEQLEARRNLRTMLVNALVYPILAVVMTIGVSAFLVIGVIPKISAFLQASGAQLPAMTQMLVDFSDWTIRNGLWILGSVGCVVGVWIAVRLVPAGREAQDALLLRLPVVGRVLKLSATAMFARAMETMISSGVTLLEALEVGAKLLTNRRYRRRLTVAHDEVMRGASLATALGEAREFLPMLSRMAAVGEMTGALAETFGETARFHETMLAVAIKRFGVLIEPVMIGITGSIVGFVYIAFFLAIFSLAGVG